MGIQIFGLFISLHRHLGALLAAGLAALIGTNVFAGTTSEAVLENSSSPSADSDQK